MTSYPKWPLPVRVQEPCGCITLSQGHAFKNAGLTAGSFQRTGRCSLRRLKQEMGRLYRPPAYVPRGAPSDTPQAMTAV